MATWLQPIFDRTKEDVDYAISKLEEWKNNGGEIVDLKGCLNVSDINRIEGDIEYLSQTMSRFYYFSTTSSKTWKETDLPNVDDMSRIIGNVRSLLGGVGIPVNAPELPITMLTYTDVNSIEENLHLLKELMDDVISHFRECGTFECGEE